MKEIWISDDRAFGKYGAIVATDKRVLIVTLESELILLDPLAAKFAPIGRAKVFADEAGLYSHPAFVGSRMYVRGASSVVCVELKTYAHPGLESVYRVAMVADRRFRGSEELPAATEDELDLGPQVAAADGLDAAVRGTFVLIPKELMAQFVAEHPVAVWVPRRRHGPIQSG